MQHGLREKRVQGDQLRVYGRGTKMVDSRGLSPLGDLGFPCGDLRLGSAVRLEPTAGACDVFSWSGHPRLGHLLDTCILVGWVFADVVQPRVPERVDL